MSKPILINETITLNPSGYTGQTSITPSNIDRAYTDSNSTTYATLTLTNSTAGYLYFTFTNPNIPSGATITSVTASVKVRINNTSRVTNTVCQLYYNTTARGSNYTFATTSQTNVISMTNTGSWTVSEIPNLRLRIGGTGANNNNTKAIYFYGADIVINYQISGTAYTTTATSTLQDVVPSPATQDTLQGETAEITIEAASLEDVAVTDNGNDVTELLVRHSYETSGTVSKTADSLTTGFSGGSSMSFYTSSSSANHNFNYAIGHTAEEPGSTSSGSGSWTYVKDNGSSTSNTGYADFAFDFSDIPENATITSVQVKCYGAVEDSSQNTSHADITLYSGNTQKSTMQSFTSSTNSIITISSPGTWTRAELQNAKLRFAVGYYGGHIFGITWSVTYSVTPVNPYYWTYTINNISADHVILIDTEGAYIPPDEDPEETYWSLTVSSINASTDPQTGTTRVVEGTNQVITITPEDPQLTLALDNGVDITSQLVGGVPTNTYTVTTQVQGASYGFNLNSSSGYYVSTNNGVSKSASVARLNLDFESDCLLTIQYINYAEENYDYGMFGKLDTTVSTNGLTARSGSSSPDDSTSNYELARCTNSSSAQTITYSVPAGEHYIDIKYGKDDASDSGNDSLQWKVLSIEPTSAGGTYTYTLNNITQNHSLIFVFGDVDYYFVTSIGTNCRLFPDGQTVKLPGDSYRLNIVPNSITDVVSITDNGNNVTSNLEREDGVDKEGNPVVSYRYTLQNIQAAHTLVITSQSGQTDFLYVKQNGAWVTVEKLFVKEDGRWVEHSLTYISDADITNIRKG